MRFTLHSNILVRAVASPQRPALRLLTCLSWFILDEVERVLLYPRLWARYQIKRDRGGALHWNLADAHAVEPLIVRPLVLPDPADDPVLYTATDGKADILCTQNIPALRWSRGAEFL